MSIERNLLISVLKTTESGAAKQENVEQEAKLPSALTSSLLLKMQTENLVYLKDNIVVVTSESRLRISVKAICLGADMQQIANYLKWEEFESIAAISLEQNGYATLKNARFTNAGKRWEIDVVGCRKPLVVCVDCKHWQHSMNPSELRKIVTAQSQRVQALSSVLPLKSLKLTCTQWKKAKFIPVIISLIPSSLKFCEGVPIVPVLQLQDFICQLPLEVESIPYFSREFSHL